MLKNQINYRVTTNNEKLQEEAYNTLLELCKNNGNKLKISFSTCNLKGLYI